MNARRPLDAADPARHALLGLLLDGPRHGYDLARAFGPTTPLGAVVFLGSSHLYALLSQLERDDLVKGAREEHGSRPPRRVYNLTESGRATVLHWLAEPVQRPRDVLLDFPLKLYLAQKHDPTHVAELLIRQRAVFADYLTSLLSEKSASRQEPAPLFSDQAFVALLREGRIARTEATLLWLDQCLPILQQEA